MKMSDSEALTLCVLMQIEGMAPWRSERQMLRFLRKHDDTGLFPELLQRSQFNRRFRQLWQAFVLLRQDLADELSEAAKHEIVDCAPVPHCSLAQAKRNGITG